MLRRFSLESYPPSRATGGESRHACPLERTDRVEVMGALFRGGRMWDQGVFVCKKKMFLAFQIQRAFDTGLGLFLHVRRRGRPFQKSKEVDYQYPPTGCF